MKFLFEEKKYLLQYIHIKIFAEFLFSSTNFSVIYTKQLFREKQKYLSQSFVFTELNNIAGRLLIFPSPAVMLAFASRLIELLLVRPAYDEGKKAFLYCNLTREILTKSFCKLHARNNRAEIYSDY